MNKVKVSREVAEAFEKLKQKRHYMTPNEILVEHVESYRYKDWFGEFEPLNDVEPLTFARMFDGYEIEPSPQEILVNFIKRAEVEVGSCDYTDQVRGQTKLETVGMILSLFNIKVSGINQ